MCAKTGCILFFLTLDEKALAVFGDNFSENHFLGFLVKIWKVLQFESIALSTEASIEPSMDI